MAKYTAETLIVEDVALWWRLHGSRHSFNVAMNASEDYRKQVPNYGEPSDEDRNAARELIASELNDWDGTEGARND